MCAMCLCLIQSNLTNPNILELTLKVKVIENENFSILSSEKRIAEVKINYNDGTEAIQRVDYAKGDPENPMTDIEIKQKFEFMMGYCGFTEKAQAILQLFEKPNIDANQLFSII